MKPVTYIVSNIKNPATEYISLKQFQEKDIKTKDYKILDSRYNVSSSLIGLAVDYVTRVYFGKSINDVFKASIAVASIIAIAKKTICSAWVSKIL